MVTELCVLKERWGLPWSEGKDFFEVRLTQLNFQFVKERSKHVLLPEVKGIKALLLM